jgi:hypothetical protein
MQSVPRVEGSGIFHIKRNLFHLRFHILSQLTISSAALRILNCNDRKRMGKKKKTSRAQASEQQLQCRRNIRLKKRD